MYICVCVCVCIVSDSLYVLYLRLLLPPPPTMLPFKPKLLIQLGARAIGYIQNSFLKLGGGSGFPPIPFSFPPSVRSYTMKPLLVFVATLFFFIPVIFNIIPHNICNASTYYYLVEKQGCPVSHPVLFNVICWQKADRTAKLTFFEYVAVSCNGFWSVWNVPIL
jgi:hypothetical protein